MAQKHDNDRPQGARAATLVLGLLIGFVAGFVVLLSILPVDHAVRDLRTSSIDTPPGNSRYDFYELLAGKANRVDQVVAPPQPVVPDEQGRMTAGPDRVYQAELHAVPREGGYSDVPRVQPDYPAPVSRPVPGNLQAMAPASIDAERYTEIPASASANERWFLQAGSFADAANAERLRAQLLLLGLESIVVTRRDAGGATGHRVRIGPFADQAGLETARRRLGQANLPYEIIRVTG